MSNTKRKIIIKIIILIATLLLISVTLFLNNKNFANTSNNLEQKPNIIKEVENNSNEVKIKENEVIVVYSKSDWLTNLKVKANSIGKFTETDLFEIESADIENLGSADNIKTEEGDIKITLVQSDKYSTEELIDMLKDKPYVKSVRPNKIYPLLSLTNDPYLQYQYALESIPGNGFAADADINPMSTNSEEEKVIAIIDTGFCFEGTELEEAIWTNPYDKTIVPGTHGYNFEDHNEDLNDEYGHGTLVASEIGAKANDSFGMAGSILDSPNIKILPLRCGDMYGLTEAAIYESYNYIHQIQELGTNVVAINNSWGSFEEKDMFDNDSSIFKPLIEMVGKAGALSVMGAGNDGTEMDENGKGIVSCEQEDGSWEDEELYYYPGGIDSDYIITVGATNEYGYFEKGFSNYGAGVDISAPGKNIFGLNAKPCFEPSLLSEEEREQYCETFYDFDDGDLTLFDTIQPDNVTISTTDEMFYGKDGKSVKIEVVVNEDDLVYDEERETMSCKTIIPFNVSTLGKQITSNRFVDLKMRGNTNKKDDLMDVTDYIATAYLNDGQNKVDVCKASNQNDDTNWNSWTSSDPFSEYFIEMFNPELEAETTMYIEFEASEAGTFSFYIDDFAVSKPFDKNGVDFRKNYYTLSGTSFAAPFVAGAIATMSNIHEDYDALQLKEAVLENAIKKDCLSKYIPEGKMLNIYKLFGKTTITEDIVEMTNLDVTITIDCNNHNEGVKLQYKIDDGEWADYKEPFVITENGTIYTRVVDANDTLECQSLNVNNIDKTLPTLNVEIKQYEVIKIEGTSYIKIPKATIGTFLNNVNTNGNIEIYKGENKIEDNYSFICTEMEVVIKLDNQERRYTVVVKGDTNKDGIANIKDLFDINEYRLEIKQPNQIELLAADVDNDNEAGIYDIFQINKYRLGILTDL